MAIEDFFPFEAGQTITTEQWNELFGAIRDGSFFLNTDPLTESITNLSSEVALLRQEVDILKQCKLRQFNKEQFILSALTASIDLSKAPVLDSEIAYFNGVVLTKNILETDTVKDYTMDGSTVVFSPEFKNQIIDDDVLTVTYQFEAV